MLKNFEDVFATFIYNSCHKSLLDGTFPEDFKTAKVVPVYKKKKRTDKCQIFKKFMNLPSTMKYMTILTEFSGNSNMDLGKVTVLSPVFFI